MISSAFVTGIVSVTRSPFIVPKADPLDSQHPPSKERHSQSTSKRVRILLEIVTPCLTFAGSLGRFLGFLACFIQASFTIAGPDYVAMTAGEASLPRTTLPRAFKSVFFRLSTFFILGSLCVGIVVPYNDPDLLDALSNAKPGAGSSPYVIAMQHLHIRGLPHIVNALIATSIFSAGNSYVYCASRTLYGLALEGKVPRFFARCTRNGVPYYCVGLTLAIALLCEHIFLLIRHCLTPRAGFLEVSNSSAVVLQW